MSSHGAGTETEAKFYVEQLEPVRARVLERGGAEISARTLERNWRFDRPDGSLSRAGEVLRLREDAGVRFTYKRQLDRAERREEIEVGLDDFDSGRAFLEALGFKVILIYEKYRRTYRLDPVSVMLDELPFGSFVEVEGPTIEDVARAAAALGLDWERRILQGYLSLYEALRARLDLPFHDATFANFADMPAVDLQALGYAPALSRVDPKESQP